MGNITWVNNYNMQIPSNTKTRISFMRTLWDKGIYSKYLFFGKVTNDSFNKETVKLENMKRVEELSNFFFGEFINFLIENNLMDTDEISYEYYLLINSRAHEIDFNTIHTNDAIDIVSNLCLDINPTMIEKIYNHWKDPNIKEMFDSDPNYDKKLGDSFIATRLFKDNPDAIVIDLAILDINDYISIMNDYPVFSMAIYHYLTKISNMKNIYLLAFSSSHAHKWIETFKKYWNYTDEEIPIIYGVNGKPINSDLNINLLNILKTNYVV